ncbi:MAG: helicase HerA domain-containing protein [Oscillochloridaceae bacterium umkhey_bin13]
MGKLFIGVVGLTLLLLLAGAIFGQLQREPTYVDYARQQVEAERLYRQAALDAFWEPIMTAAINVALIVALFGGAIYLAALGVGQFAFFRQYARPDERGLLPILRSDQDTAQRALEGHHTAQIASATRPVPPAHLVYSPHISYRTDGATGSRLSSEPAALTLPGLTDLAHLNFTPSVNAILLGLDAGGVPITVPMKDLWHIGTAGPTGAGKSNIARLIIPQLQRLGANVAIIDPKWTPYDAESDEDWRPIARRLFMTPARKADEISDTIGFFDAELGKRLELRNAGQKVGPPLFLYADEFTTITADVKKAEERIARLSRLGRGVKIFLLIAAHDLLVKSGAGDTRDQLRTGFYLGGDTKTGSVLLDLPQRTVSEQEVHLTPGIALLRSVATSPPKLVRIPYASNAGVRALLGDGAEDRADFGLPSFATSGSHSADRVGSDAGSGYEVSREAPASGVPMPNSRDARILALVRQQKGVSEIIAEVWGVKGGSKYSEYSAEVMRVIAQALKVAP